MRWDDAQHNGDRADGFETDPHAHDRFDGDPELIDLHLGHIDQGKAADVQARVAADPALAGQHAALGAAFDALRRWRASDGNAPADLAQRILARVRAEEAERPALRVRPADLEAIENPHIIRIHGLRDIVAVAAMIVVAVGLGVPSLLHMKDRNQRALCAANLAQLGTGMQTYANSFGSHLPFVGWDADSSWRPTAERGARVRPNRIHLFPLLRNGYVATGWLVCPGSHGDVAVPEELVRRIDGFPESRNLSFAYQNMAGRRPSVATASSAMPVLSDDNPLFDNGVPVWEGAAHRLGLRDLAGTNSRNHGGAGQNVLSLDGSATWHNTPSAGVGGENIWTLSDVERYTGREGPVAASDAHLIK